jgi:formimidoylglutamate deiminase
MNYTHIATDYVYTSHGWQKNQVLSISKDGCIASIIGEEQFHEQMKLGALPEGQVLHNVHSMALLPGFVNAHSHVFQRALRGHTHRALSQKDTFWTWRNAMYAEAQRLTPESLYETALKTYKEMLKAGYTTVGEFHYVHHQPDGQLYAHANEMANAVMNAAEEAGIHLVLLMTAYAQSGFNQPPTQGQRRFCDASVDAYLQRVDDLRVRGVAVGLAPHSVRAVPETWFRAIADYSRQYKLPIHVHADEQMQEIEQCQVEYGCTPIELLERFGALGPQTTIIHATHANATELALLAKNNCTVCVCPTTEGDLGDGIAPYAELMAHDILLAIGSDSNTRLDPIEELRWAEYSARMRYQRRRVLVCDKIAPSPGPLLLDIGTHGGAIALGHKQWSIEAGSSADFVAIDLKHPSLAGWNEEDLLDVLFFGASADVIVQTWVGGKRIA